MKKIADILYKQAGDIPLYLDLALPDAQDGGSPPLILWIHGGAWYYGTREDQIMLWLVNRGYAVASVDYRLAGQGTFPDNITDCKDALLFLKRNEGGYAYDSTRIAVAGESAGGHLAALMGTSVGHADWEPPGADCSVKAVVNYYGASDFLRGSDTALAPDSVQSNMLGVAVGTAKGRALAHAASPIPYIDGSEPPFLLLHGDADPIMPYRQSTLLRDALEAAGSSVALFRVYGGGHGFDCPAADETIAYFLDLHLRSR